MTVQTGQDFSMVAGQSFALDVTVSDENGTPVALPDVVTEAVWQLLRSWGEAPVVTKRLTEGGITVNGQGVAQVELAPADTAGLVGVYFHELSVRDTGDKEYPVAQGTAYLRAGAVEAL